MDGNQYNGGMLAIFSPEADLDALRLSLGEAGISREQVTVLSPLPPPAADQTSHPFWPYGITIAAGIVGIAVGVFFAAGTAALYPLATGGKPIVAAPVVGIISYETMMLFAIVVTFLTMITRLKRAQRRTVDRETGIDDGHLAVSVRLEHEGQEGLVRRLFESAHAQDIRLVSHDPLVFTEQPSVRAPAAIAALTWMAMAAGGCSQDMQDQPSYRSQEAPRLHSPSGSIPRSSRAMVSSQSLPKSQSLDQAKLLYRINCLPCHGDGGEGTGPVAPYLNKLPANLRASRVRRLSTEELYQIITHGKDMMPAFRGELSATERMMIASFIQALEPELSLTTP